MKSTAAKLSALIAVTDCGYGADYARAWPYRYGTYGVWSGAPRTYTDVSNYTEGTMILDLVNTRTNKLVFRGAGRRRDPFPGRHFDITEYTQAAATIGDATKQLQTLVTMLEHDAPAATLLGEAMRGHAERVVDHLYKRVIEVFGVLFVGVLLIVVTSWLLRAQAGAAGCKKNLCGGQGALKSRLPWKRQMTLV